MGKKSQKQQEFSNWNLLEFKELEFFFQFLYKLPSQEGRGGLSLLGWPKSYWWNLAMESFRFSNFQEWPHRNAVFSIRGTKAVQTTVLCLWVLITGLWLKFGVKPFYWEFEMNPCEGSVHTVHPNAQNGFDALSLYGPFHFVAAGGENRNI